MKTILLSLLSLTTTLSTCVWAEEGRPDEKVPPALRGRIEEAKERFQAEMEKHMKAAMEEAAKLEAEGKKEEAETLRRRAKEKLRAAIDEHQRATKAKIEAAMRERTKKHEGGDREKPGSEHREGDNPEGGDKRQRAEMENKLKHVEQAIAYLREAGLMDAVADLSRLADRLRAGLRGDGDGRRDEPRKEDGRREEPKREDQRRAEPRHEDRPANGDVEALRREVQELRRAIQQIAEKQQGDRR